ncbi:MAG: hypothetical protein ACF8MF_00835 [Phycisphaerales bacterium JB052]
MSPSHSQKKSDEHHSQPSLREPRFMLSDLFDELIWPRVLRAPALALSPNRMLSGCVAVFLVSLVLRLYDLLRGAPNDDSLNTSRAISISLGQIGDQTLDGITSLNPVAFSSAATSTATLVRDSVMHNPLLSILLGIPMVAIIALAGGAIARSAAFEFAQGRFASREETLYFTLQRARQFVTAVLGPVAFSILVLMLIALGGLLLSVPIVDILGAVLYGIGLAMGIIATVVLMLHVIAIPMIIPALAIEGTDAFDAIQRSYAYVVGRPLRYLTYIVLLTLLGVLAVTIFALVARQSVEWTNWAATFLANDATDRALTGSGELGATKKLAHSTIAFWRSIIDIIVAGYIVSIFFTSASLLYLSVRRICDGQGVSEIWEPVAHD